MRERGECQRHLDSPPATTFGSSDKGLWARLLGERSA